MFRGQNDVRANLPDTFIANMQQLLGTDSNLFLQSFDMPRTFGLRLNPLKLAALPEAVMEQLPVKFGLEPVSWCKAGYYYEESSRPGKHPYHAAGLYYIQEPSAMTAAELLDPQPGELVLDLAAAPGGKTTQIAGKMAGQGLLVSNEIHPGRAKILSENVERCGIVNAIVTCAAPDELSRRFPAFFDRIMLDAPCSGEGMFRKDENAIAEWSPAHVAMCAARQNDILQHAAIMLKPGGRLVYSTCTFNKQENEETIQLFCSQHPQFEWVASERIWPHLARGEGHFVAVLQKSADAPDNALLSEARTAKSRSKGKSGQAKNNDVNDMLAFYDFTKTALPHMPRLEAGEPVRFGDALYWLPSPSAEARIAADRLHGLKVLRPGLHLGDMRKNRIEPAHALAMSLQAADAAWHQSCSADSDEAAAFLRGETIPALDGAAGWGIVAVDGLPIGWGKASGGQVKNHLPKGLRRTY
ncbi:RsmF rRNA methyltransferase first C-terminal domain-containing protein [Paenibacillus sp. GCM10027626]|uniref:RsmF rRNA methyltransferase first C-terminal domain-containing protein n=1 Tax=Paenibacillus sp. GCM10027626 TaxID=3273411 RepID=UPI0036404037